MITTYSDYIERFLLLKGQNDSKSPGEHHFVAAYLLPRLFKINQVVPDYINPDGTKGITGDIVYFRKGVHYLGIEVKFETVRLTKNEYNNWIVNEDTSQHPEIFIGIGTDGIIILSWHKFREAYLALSRITNPQPIPKGYGPQKEVNVLFRSGNGEGYLPRSSNESQAEKFESEFVQLLEKSVNR